ncbi:MAG: hypothetical protein H6797_01270 [Candidatus Nomurabacteria bacterium]|nr:MAG: hypothetical protein H6797_01270 [Candidatus Nomurabacteria bacterium]
MGKKILQIAYRIISSKKIFSVIVGLLFIQAAWFALTAQYPLAFDENYHFGVIQLYSHQLLPFMSTQPPASESYSDLTRYDSYMFHYLMSFPYRVISLFISNQTAQIIILRFINIGLFIGGMYLFRNLLRHIRTSEALINFSFLILILIPIIPFLAATINYDNLAFVIAPLFISLTISCSQAIKRRNIPAKTFIYMLAAGIFGSLVKYAFVPIFLAGLIYLFIIWLQTGAKQKTLKSIWRSFILEQRLMKIVLAAVAILSIGLFVERYGVNLITYHRYEPTCDQIRSVSECAQFGPWGRDYNTKATVKATNPPHDPPMQFFAPVWVGNYVFRLYFAINYDYDTQNPLPIPYITAYVIGIFGLLLCLVFWRSIIRINRYLLLFALVIALYVGALFYTNFTGYLKLHTIVAANGRYLVLIMPILFVWIGLAYRELFIRYFKGRTRNALVSLSIIVLCLTLNGGGMETHLLRSQANWYWKNGPAPSINMTLKNTLAPTVVGSSN